MYHFLTEKQHVIITVRDNSKMKNWFFVRMEISLSSRLPRHVFSKTMIYLMIQILLQIEPVCLAFWSKRISLFQFNKFVILSFIINLFVFPIKEFSYFKFLTANRVEKYSFFLNVRKSLHDHVYNLCNYKHVSASSYSIHLIVFGKVKLSWTFFLLGKF